MSYSIKSFVESVLQKHLGVHHVWVHRGEELVANFHFLPTDRRTDIFSASKAVVAMAIGLAEAEGILRLDEHVMDTLRPFAPADLDRLWERVTIRDLLMMASGQRENLLVAKATRTGEIARDALPDPDWAHYVLGVAPEEVPGTIFVYNNSSPYLLSRLLAEKTGENLLQWLKPRLFKPLDIGNPQWTTDPLGHPIGLGGLLLSSEEFARLTVLSQQYGRWQGQQLLPEEFMRAATAKQIESVEDFRKQDRDDHSSGYGYYYWRARRDDAFYLSGWGGQLGVCVPRANLAVTVTGYEFQTQRLLDVIWRTIVEPLCEDCN